MAEARSYAPAAAQAEDGVVNPAIPGDQVLRVILPVDFVDGRQFKPQMGKRRSRGHWPAREPRKCRRQGSCRGMKEQVVDFRLNAKAIFISLYQTNAVGVIGVPPATVWRLTADRAPISMRPDALARSRVLIAR